MVGGVRGGVEWPVGGDLGFRWHMCVCNGWDVLHEQDH